MSEVTRSEYSDEEFMVIYRSQLEEIKENNSERYWAFYIGGELIKNLLMLHEPEEVKINRYPEAKVAVIKVIMEGLANRPDLCERFLSGQGLALSSGNGVPSTEVHGDTN